MLDGTQGSNQPNPDCRKISRTNDLISPMKEWGKEGKKKKRGWIGIEENDIRDLTPKKKPFSYFDSSTSVVFIRKTI